MAEDVWKKLKLQFCSVTFLMLTFDQIDDDNDSTYTNEYMQVAMCKGSGTDDVYDVHDTAMKMVMFRR